ncbi:unnamed protein product, partial [Timema podura]|nr:unnamed protein product [Timema podura]
RRVITLDPLLYDMFSHHSGTRYVIILGTFLYDMFSYHSGTSYVIILGTFLYDMFSHHSGTSYVIILGTFLYDMFNHHSGTRVDLELCVQVEENMRNTLRSTLGRSLEDLKTKERKDWVLKWPGQLVIAGSQTEWTSHVEQGILEEKLPDYYSTMLEQLDDLRGLVKGPLERVERQVLSALIVIEVHARDVLANLLKENVKNINDFEWISQLRGVDPPLGHSEGGRSTWGCYWRNSRDHTIIQIGRVINTRVVQAYADNYSSPMASLVLTDS